MSRANPLAGSDSAAQPTIDVKPVSCISLASGIVVAERYELDRLLGGGGMGEVWSATHLLTRKPVALKFLTGPVNLDRMRRFVREARAASAVRHPNVVEIHDILMPEHGAPALVMELLVGETLGERLRRSGSLSLDELASIMVPVISAVGAAHAAGVVHRDLKPDNIFLARLGDGRVEPKVLDFGVCKLKASEGLAMAEVGQLQFLGQPIAAHTMTGALMGTPCYMAPEQVFGEKDVDARADVWALGVILYECSTGKRPVDGENIGQTIKLITSGAITPIDQLAPDLPPQYSNMVNRMLAQDRERRWSDLREVFATLRSLTGQSALSFGRAVDGPSDTLPTGTASSPGGLARLGARLKVWGGSRASSVSALAVILGIVVTLGALGWAGASIYRGRQTTLPAEVVPGSPPPAIGSQSLAGLPGSGLGAGSIVSKVAAEAPQMSATVPAERLQPPASVPRDRRARTSAPAKNKRGANTMVGGIHETVPF